MIYVFLTDAPIGARWAKCVCVCVCVCFVCLCGDGGRRVLIIRTVVMHVQHAVPVALLVEISRCMKQTCCTIKYRNVSYVTGWKCVRGLVHSFSSHAESA